MGLMDKITGRAKKAAGDLADDSSLRREGRQEERKGEAKDELAGAQDKADRKDQEVANLERKTSWRRFSRPRSRRRPRPQWPRSRGSCRPPRRRRHRAAPPRPRPPAC